MTKIAFCPKKDEKEYFWKTTISGSQSWKMFDTKEFYLLLANKFNYYSEQFSDFAKKSMQRGIERESIIIEKLGTSVEKNENVYYDPIIRISGTPDAFDHKNKIVYEIKSSKSEITKQHAYSQIHMYYALLVDFDAKFKDYSYVLVMENPSTFEVTQEIIKIDIEYATKMLFSVRNFWNLYMDGDNLIDKSIDSKIKEYNLLLEQVKTLTAKANEIKQNYLSHPIRFGKKCYYMNYTKETTVIIRAREASTSIRKVNYFKVEKKS